MFKSAQSDLLARLSHEMRTPLSAILGFAQLVESGTPSPTGLQQRRMHLILQAGWYLEKLINMTHDLALIELGTLPLALDTVPLAEVMRDVQVMIESKAQLRGVHVIFPVFETPCFVSADRIRLQQVLSDLLSAAIEYSEWDRALVVGWETRGSECIRIRIHDGGEGLSAQQGTRPTQAFDRLEREASAAEGASIGLVLAQRLVELMGGAIGTQSTVGTGKVFSLDLRRIAVPTAAETLDIVFNACETSAANGIAG